MVELLGLFIIVALFEWLFGFGKLLSSLVGLLFLAVLGYKLGVVGSLLLVLIIVNFYATYCWMRTPDVEKQKKNYQIAFVWLIPFIGAFTVWYSSKPEPLLEPHGGHGSSISGGSVAGTNYYSGSDSGGSGSDY